MSTLKDNRSNKTSLRELYSYMIEDEFLFDKSKGVKRKKNNTKNRGIYAAVSYTHLTLPTIVRV